MAVEQVFFTWAKRGLAGHGMLQPVRASEGFNNLGEQDRKLALTLCQYDAGTAAKKGYPASLGWIDRGSTRFAFSRVFLRDPALQTGRPGNFAAHIAIGPASLLPVRDLLSRFLSGLWWQGPRSSGDLALPDSPDWPKSPRPSHSHAGVATAEAILSSLLQGRHPIRTDAKPDELLAALMSIVGLLPQALDGFSVSTFEGSRMATWFDIAGSQPTVRTPLISEAQYLLARPTVADWLPALHPKDDPRRTGELAEVRAWIAVSRDLAAGHAQPGSLVRILRLPRLVPRALSEFPTLAGALADAVATLDPTVVQALQSAGTGLQEAALQKIGHEAGAIVLASQVDRVSAALASMPGPFHDAYARAIVVRAEVLPYVHQWSDATINRFLGAALERSAPPAARAAVEARLVEVGRPVHLLDRNLSFESRAALFASLSRRWTRPWALSIPETTVVLRNVQTKDIESLSEFFSSARNDELEIRLHALITASPTWPTPLRLSSKATRTLLQGASSLALLQGALASLDLAVMTSQSDRQFLGQVVLEALERYERDPNLCLSPSFWTALARNPETEPYALAHARLRAVGPGPWSGFKRGARVTAFLEFEARALASNAHHLDEWVKSIRGRELGWLVVTTLRGARAGASRTWVVDGLDVVFRHSRLWLPGQIGRSLLGSDSLTSSIRELARLVAKEYPHDFACLCTAQPDETLRLLQQWNL